MHSFVCNKLSESIMHGATIKIRHCSFFAPIGHFCLGKKLYIFHKLGTHSHAECLD